MAQVVGRLGDIPAGGVALFDVEGKSIAVANVGGRLFAFDDVCTHRGCSLASGRLDDTSITCPCHGSVFQVTDGSVASGPATEPLRTYEVQVVDDELSILVGNEPAEDHGTPPRIGSRHAVPGVCARPRGSRIGRQFRPDGSQAHARRTCIGPSIRRPW